jgi:CheY-like chemotaxis protein
MTRRYGGTGLGLAIARRLTELMKGSIGFESEPGQGSLFWFELPLEPCAPAEQEHGARFSSRPAGVIASRTTRRLLLSRLRTIGLTPAAFPSEAAAWADLPEGSLLFVEQVGSVTAKLRDGQSVTLAVPIRLSQLILRLETLLPDEAHSASEDLNCLRGMRVLLAEDNAVNAHLARSLLQKFGMNVAIADNGAKAVSAYALEPYDLVLMDLQMPEMDGFEATRRIRGIERAQQLQRTPVVALTASVFRSERESCHAAGMDDFVAKPVERQELQRVLVRWCRNARAEA